MSRWYAFIWIETITNSFYLALPFNDLNSAILRLFDEGRISPNEFNDQFQEIKKACLDSPIVCQSVDKNLPAWLLAEGHIMTSLVKELKTRKIPVVLNQ